MKYIIVLCLTSVLLSGCGLVRSDPLTPQRLQIIAPDVPQIEKKTQQEGALEMEANKSPALNKIVNSCLMTRDESRVLRGGK